MKLRFGRLLVACTLALAFCFPLFGVAHAEDSDSGEKKKQEPIKRVWSAQPSLEPVTEAAKNFARAIQGQIGTTITKQRLQEQSTPKNKKNALGQSARFAVNDVNADGTRAVGGRVVTASGDLYVSYLPTADGVVGVIEASTRLPTKSKADKKRRTELSVAGFRLNKVVEYYQFAFWPKGASKSLAAVVSQPPEFVSNGIYPARAAQLLTTPKKNAKSAPKGNFEGVPVPIAWMCGTAFDPVPPDAGGENSGTTCNSSREEIAQCKGPVLCESLRSGAQSGSGSGCCCQPEQPVESQPVAIEIPKSLDPQSKEDEITIPESPELGQQPVEGGHWQKEGSIPIPASPDSPGPQPVEGGHAKPAEEAPSQASPGDAQVAVPSNVPSLTTEDSPTLATNPSGEDKNSDEKTYNQIVNAIVDDYTRTMHECPSATVIKSLDAAIRAYPAPALKECFSSAEAEDPSNDDGESAAPEGEDDTTYAAAEEEDDTPPMLCTKSEKLERLLQLAKQYIPKTPEALQTAECESKGKSLEELIDDQRAFIRGTKTRLALVRKDIKDLQSGYITSFVGKVYGTLGAMQQQEAIEVAQLAAQETRLSELQNTPKPKCGVGDLKPIIQTSETIEAERKIRERLGTQQTVLGLSEVGLEVTKLGLKFGAVVVTAPASGTSVALVMALKTLAGTAVGAAGNLGEAASHVDQGSKDVSQALTDASVATAHDAALALGVAGGEQMGLLVQTLGGPRSLLFVKLLAGAGGGTTTGSLDVAVKYATEGLSPEEAAYTVGLSGIMGMVSGGTASNKLGRDIAANLLIGTLGAVASGESSTKGLVKAAVENSMLAYVGNRAANKCQLQPSQTKSKPSTDPASNPPQKLAPHLSASVTERLVPGLTEKVAGLPQGAQESINSWLREKAQKAKPYVEGQETFTVPRSDSIKVKGSEERRRVYEYDWYGEWTAEGPPVKLIEERPVSDVLLIDFVQEPSTGQVVKITDVQYVPKEPVLTGELPWELRAMPPGGVNETSPLLTADKLPRLPEGKVVVPELVADRKATWKRDISEQITKLPPEVQEPITKVMNEMEKTTKWDENSVKNIDFLVDHSFEVTGTDGKRYTVNCLKDPLSEKLVAINEVVPQDSTPVSPKPVEEPNLPPVNKKGEQLSAEAIENRRDWLVSDVPAMIRESKCPLHAQEPLKEWLMGKARDTDWNRNPVSDAINAPAADLPAVIETRDGALYKFTYFEDQNSGRVISIADVTQIRAPIKPPPLQKSTQSSEEVTLQPFARKLTQTVSRATNYVNDMLGWAEQPQNCPPNARVGFENWLKKDLPTLDFGKKPIQFPGEEQRAIIDGIDGKYEFTFRRDTATGKVEPTGVKFLRDLLPSEQAAREWPALRQKVMDALYPADDGLPPNPRNIEETLNVLKDKGLLSEDQVAMLIEESQKAPPSSDEQAFAEFLDGFEDRLFAARKEMLNGQGESAP